jgi:hypothetical protein
MHDFLDIGTDIELEFKMFGVPTTKKAILAVFDQF